MKNNKYLWDDNYKPFTFWGILLSDPDFKLPYGTIVKLSKKRVDSFNKANGWMLPYTVELEETNGLSAFSTTEDWLIPNDCISSIQLPKEPSTPIILQTPPFVPSTPVHCPLWHKLNNAFWPIEQLNNKEIALSYIAKQETDQDIATGTNLNNSFYWKLTPQGWEFWENISHNILKE